MKEIRVMSADHLKLFWLMTIKRVVFPRAGPGPGHFPAKLCARFFPFLGWKIWISGFDQKYTKFGLEIRQVDWKK